MVKKWIQHLLGLAQLEARIAEMENKMTAFSTFPAENVGKRTVIPADVIGEWLNGGERK